MQSGRLPSARALRQQLKHLKLKEQRIRRLKKSMQDADAEAKARVDPHKLLSSSALPRNDELERALLQYHAFNRDPRKRLDVLRAFFPSTVLSIASPVGRWDPFDLKPQPFALGTYLGLPVFTSLPYLQEFCRRYALVVRGPDGALWGDNSPPPPDKYLPPPLRHNPKTLKRAAPSSPTAAQRRAFEAKQKEQAETDEWLRRASDVEQFDFSGRATPVPLYGPFECNYLYGYFGDAVTVLENAGTVPESVDIVLNPATPLELVLGRAAVTSFVTQGDLLNIALRDAARVVAAELAAFFRKSCPDVESARWANIPQPVPPGTPVERVPYDLVVSVKTRDFNSLLHRVAKAVTSGKLQSHESLSLLALQDTPDHVAAASIGFYDRAREREARDATGLIPIGEPLVVDTATGTTGGIQDGGLGYLEAHTAFLSNIPLMNTTTLDAGVATTSLKAQPQQQEETPTTG